MKEWVKGISFLLQGAPGGYIKLWHKLCRLAIWKWQLSLLFYFHFFFYLNDQEGGVQMSRKKKSFYNVAISSDTGLETV